MYPDLTGALIGNVIEIWGEEPNNAYVIPYRKTW